MCLLSEYFKTIPKTPASEVTSGECVQENISGNSSDEESGKFYNKVFICSNRYMDFIVVFLYWVVTNVKEIVLFLCSFHSNMIPPLQGNPKTCKLSDHYMMREMTKIILLMSIQQMVRPA